VCEKAEAAGVVAGLDLGRIAPNLADRLLIAVTEKHRKQDLDRLIDVLSRV
jgi:glycine cleavage system pyridoxal-binding protein P